MSERAELYFTIVKWHSRRATRLGACYFDVSHSRRVVTWGLPIVARRLRFGNFGKSSRPYSRAPSGISADVAARYLKHSVIRIRYVMRHFI